MSERGSFVTQYMYCDNCFQRLKKVLGKGTKRLNGVAIRHYNVQCGGPHPIIAGKVGGSFAGEELITFQHKLFNKDNAPCHPVRIAIHCDTGESVTVIVMPSGRVVDYTRREYEKMAYGWHNDKSDAS